MVFMPADFDKLEFLYLPPEPSFWLPIPFMPDWIDDVSIDVEEEYDE